jgi:hypothetical protein
MLAYRLILESPLADNNILNAIFVAELLLELDILVVQRL